MKKIKIISIIFFLLTLSLLSNLVFIKAESPYISVDTGDRIQWNFYFYGTLDGVINMEITNVSYVNPMTTVEGNVSWLTGVVIEPQGVLLLYNGVSLSVSGQFTMLGLGGVGLIPTPLNLDLLSSVFDNYTINGKTITEVENGMTYELTYNDDGILTTGRILVDDVENYRINLRGMNLPPPGGTISFGHGALIFLSIGIVASFVVMKKRIINN